MWSLHLICASGIPTVAGNTKCCRSLSFCVMWHLPLASRAICGVKSKTSEPAVQAANGYGSVGGGLRYTGAQEPAKRGVPPHPPPPLNISNRSF